MQFRRQITEPVQVNITPLIDVVFLLLIFFMITTQFPDQQLNLQLPESTTANPVEATDPRPVFRLALFAGGGMQLDDQEIADQDALIQALQQRLEENPEPALLIRAEEDTTHQQLVQVLDTARLLGIQRLRIATRPEE
ncbi:ExbD/TolR family protein [Marinospirillum perlucidum]|uniref:ExbD/TolR family protein n=1 Tax=Marinospirillum perlucidum TaxID=1982602 RepID=UPI000DF37793|nr:biopolymer transporter ExbD [Marinospirillum perlucidum]